MKVRMGGFRALGLGAVTTLVASGLGALPAPPANAADPLFPAPDSASWLAVKKGSAPLTDGVGEVDNAHLDLSPTGGASGDAVAFLHADLEHAFFRFHAAAEFPDGGAGAFILQFDTDNNVSGWERALRYEPAAGTVTIFSSEPNSAANAKGTVVSSTALPTPNKRSYPGADGGGHVAFALSRAALNTAGINLGAPMVIGTTIEPSADSGAALNAGALLILTAKADILGAGKAVPAWQSVASDPIDIDSDGDGIADRVDNCPVVVNPGQEDDDAAVDNSLPPGTRGVPDGTEGRGNACDRTPRGYDLDKDKVGLMDDQCPEQYGALANGCVAQSTTTATLRYVAQRKRFKGAVRADFDQCQPRRTVTVFRSVAGPDRQIGSPVKTDGAGKYALPRLSSRPKAGKYYARVDSKWTLGARCFAVKSPKIQVG